MALPERLQLLRSTHSEARPQIATVQGAIWIVVAIALAYAGYFVLRYGTLWTENDTSQFALFATGTVKVGSVLSGNQYTHGFGYPSWLAALSLLTGMPAPVLNTVVLPFVGAVFLVVPAFVAYRTLLGSQRAGLLATVLLFGVPDLLFSVMRGNHEKLDIAFMLLGIYVLFKGFAAMGQGSAVTLAIWSLLFYALTFGNAMVNDYFASTLATASTLTLIVGYWLTRGRPNLESRRPAILRYAMVVAVSWLLILSVVFFVFPPAGQDFKLLTTTLEKLRSLFLTLAPSSNPYSLASHQWASPLAATIISAFRWVLLGGSFVVWLVKMWDVVVRGGRPSLERLFLLSLYGAFGVIMAISIPVDFTGIAAGSNLELRNFTYFSLLSAPLLAWGIRDTTVALHSLASRRRATSGLHRFWGENMGRLYPTLAAAVFAFASFVGLLKVTVDPAVSNQWIFYSLPEYSAIKFFEQHGRSDILWSGPDLRLVNVATQWYPGFPHNNLVRGYSLLPRNRLWLSSPQVHANSTAYGTIIPSYANQDRVYDNGDAQLYRVVLRTQFQH